MSAALVWVKTEWARSNRLLYLLTWVVTSGVTFAALELWAARLAVPLGYSGDALAVGAHFKTVIETGWYEYQPQLGAPFGQTYNDFPTADNLHFMAARVLSLFTSDWPVAMNLYYLIGFPLAAVAAVWLFRRLDISRTFSLVLGVVYAIAPYHFIRGEGHLWLASYYVVPFAVGLVLMVIRGEALWAWRENGPRALRWASGRTLTTLAIIALTGTAQQYYAVFFLLLLAFAGLVRLISSGQWSRFWGAAITGGLTVVVMVINMGPDILYSLINGENPGGFERGHSEAEIYALKLAQLLLPWSGHRIGILKSIREQYDAHYPLLSESPALGGIAAAGFVALFLILAFVAASFGSTHRRAVMATPQFRLLTQLASLTFVAFIFSTVGGLSTIISFVTASIRGWNRMSIVIAILCLVAVGVLLDAAVKWLQSKVGPHWLKRTLAFGVAGVVLVAGYVDQTPSDASSSYASTAERFTADRTWIASIEDSVPPGSMILQLPYQPFPESLGPTGILSSEALMPYLQSDQLRWSAGGIKGRPRADWPGSLQQLPPADIAQLAAAGGFAGIHIDRASLTATDAAALQAGLSEMLGSPRTSADERYLFYSLATLRSKLESEVRASELDDIGARVVDPVTVSTDPSFQTGISETDTIQYRSASLTPFLTLTNARDTPVSVTLSLGFTSLDPSLSRILVTLPNATTRTVDLTDGAGTLTVAVDAAPGKSTVAFSAPGANTDPMAGLVLTRVLCVEDAVSAFLAR